LAEFTGEAFVQIELPRLRELRLAAVLVLMDAELAAGRAAELVSELLDWTSRYPLNERLPGQLMLALYRAGRQAEALEVFQRTRRRLADELGVDPGPALRELEAAVLAHDPHLGDPPGLVDAAAQPALVPGPPAQGRTPSPVGLSPTAGGDGPVGQTELQSPGAEDTTHRTTKAWGIPGRTVAFTGRTELLSGLRSALRSGGRAAIHAVHGIGGVGKTTTAIEYAHRYAADYDIAWWIPAENPALIPEQLAALSRSLNLAAATDDTDAAIARLLADLRDRGRWLLVFDNAEEPAELTRFLPPGPGHTVITSRNPDWHGTAVPVPLEQFRRHESVAVLQRRVPALAQSDADDIAAALGDLPLAVGQAGALIADTGLTAAAYLQLLQQRTREVLDHPQVEGARSSMAASWAVAVDRLAVDDPLALQLLTMGAWLAPEPIPLTLITEHSALLPNPLKHIAADPLAITRLTGSLRRRGMVTTDQGTFSMHRVPAALLRAATGDEQLDTGDWPATVIRLLRHAVPDDPFNNPSTWSAWRSLLPHVLAAIDPGRAGTGAADDVAPLLRLAGEYLMTRGGDPRAALPLLERAYRLNVDRLAPDDPEMFGSVGFLASVLNMLGEFDRAGQLNKETLDRTVRILGPDHLWTLRTATNYAIYLRSLHQHEQAHRVNQDAYSRARRTLGVDHPMTLDIANGLAINLGALDQYERALELDEDTVRRSQNVLGENHPDTLSTAHNLGNDLRGLGRFEQARQSDEDIGDRMRQVLGEEHHDVLGMWSNLALDLHGLGDYDKARQLNEDILARTRKVLGDDHPQTLRTGHSLAADLRALGNYQQALELDEDILARRQRTLRPDHPDTLNSAHNLATDHAALGHHDTARQLDQDTLTRRRSALGDRHPATLASAHNLSLDEVALREPSSRETAVDLVRARQEVKPANDLSAFR
jgi:tetratricopeptide (TPR) repeat protein